MSNKDTKDVTPTQNTGNMNDKQAMSALKNNASNIITVITIVLAGYFGWTYYQDNKPTSIDTVASDKFTKIQDLNKQSSMANIGVDLPEPMQKQLAESQKKMDVEIDSLATEHKNSAFTWQALMIKAHNQTDAGNDKASIETLKLAAEMSIEDTGLQSIAQIRYAQALLANNDFDTALSVASNEMPESFEATKQEILGDVYLAKKDTEAAIRSYKNAWSILTKRNESRKFLALKMESLGIDFEPITEELVVSIPKVQTPKTPPLKAMNISREKESKKDEVRPKNPPTESE